MAGRKPQGSDITQNTQQHADSEVWRSSIGCMIPVSVFDAVDVVVLFGSNIDGVDVTPF